MADMKYLLKQRQGYYVRIKVPADLRDKIGKRFIVKTLRTRDLTVAQSRRHAVVAEIMADFARLREPANSALPARAEFQLSLEGWRESVDGDWSPDYPFGEYLRDYLDDKARCCEGTPDYDAALYLWQERAGQEPILKDKYKLPLSETVKAYLDEVRRDPNAKPTEQTLKQHEAVFELFRAFTKDAPIESTTRDTAAKFLDHMAAKRSLSNKTLNRYSSSMNGLFAWAIQRGYYTGQVSPFKGQFRKVGPSRKTSWLPFEDDEVLSILAHTGKLPATKPMHWIPLIGAYSGMRLNEICSLDVADIGTQDGIRFFDIREAKTEAGIRRVPVHSAIIEAGFEDYLEDRLRSVGKALEGLPKAKGRERSSKDGRLFPSLKPAGPDGKLSWLYSKRFTTMRRRVGIKRPRVNFHSFRKAVGTKLENARIPENEAVQVLGHEKLSMSYNLYSLGVNIKRLQEIVEAVRYEKKEDAL